MKLMPFYNNIAIIKLKEILKRSKIGPQLLKGKSAGAPRTAEQSAANQRRRMMPK